MRFYLFIFFASIITSPSQASAPVTTPFGKVTTFATNWRHNSVMINLENVSASSYNPDGCTDSSAFNTNPADPDPMKSLNHSILLSAAMAGKRIRFVVDGCAFNRPAIISVQLEP